MVHFTLYGPAALFCSCARCTPLGMRVTPFGHPRIRGHVHLPAASRSLSRPSSPGGSTGIRRGPMLAWPYLPSRPLSRGSQGHAKYHILHSRPGPQSSPPSFLPFSTVSRRTQQSLPPFIPFPCLTERLSRACRSLKNDVRMNTRNSLLRGPSISSGHIPSCFSAGQSGSTETAPA